MVLRPVYQTFSVATAGFTTATTGALELPMGTAALVSAAAINGTSGQGPAYVTMVLYRSLDNVGIAMLGQPGYVRGFGGVSSIGDGLPWTGMIPLDKNERYKVAFLIRNDSGSTVNITGAATVDVKA